VAIPSGVQVFCLIATVAAGKLRSSVPTLFAVGALAIFVLGGLTGVMLALAPFDFQAHDTFFVVGHFHYVLIGGALFPVVGALYYYFPLAVGRQLSDRLGRAAFWLMFAGFNLAFFPMHLAGLRGMPRRVFTYPAGLGLEAPNLLSTAGAFVLAAGLFVVLYDVLRRKRGDPPRNPWDAGTLEWLPALPAETWGVRSIPVVRTRYPLWEQEGFAGDVDAGRFYLPDAAELRRETLVTTVLDARPVQVMRLGGPTWVTHWAAAAIGGFFALGTFALWVPALLSLAAGVLIVCRWLWTGSSLIPEREEKDAGLGLSLPLYQSGPSSVGWWAMAITMLAVLAAFASLVFGYFFFWTVRADFPPKGTAGPGLLWPSVGAGLMLAAWALTQLCRRLNRREEGTAFYISLAAAVGCAAAGGLATLAGPWTTGLDAARHSYDATVWTLAAWTAVHALAGIVMLLYCAARRFFGVLTPRYDSDLANTGLYWHFAALTAAVTAAVIGGFPRLL
jgi:cytochrome c oxidase subunit I+III